MANGQHITRSLCSVGGLAATLVLALALPCGVLFAQPADTMRTIQVGAEERTHEVKVGDTLWELAEQYLGDGLLWRVIARRNNIVVASSVIVPIKVGQRLVIPLRSAVPEMQTGMAAGELAVPQMALAPALRDTSPSAVLHIDELLAERAKRRIGLVGGAEYALAKDSAEGETVFRREVPSVEAVARTTSVMLAARAPSPRRAEFESAPFEIGKASLAMAGHIVRRLGTTTTDGRLLRNDRVEVVAGPKGRFAVGDRLVAFRISNAWRSHQIAVPAGILEVVAASEGTTPMEAVVRAQTGTIEPGQLLIVAEGDPAARNTAVRLATPDIEASVMWLDPAQGIPTLQSFMMLGAGAEQGVRPGDEFAVYAKGKGVNEQMFATVRVVRTGTTTSAALMTRQYAPGVHTGAIARRYAKVP